MDQFRSVRCERCDTIVHVSRWERCYDCRTLVLCPICVKHHEALGHRIEVTLQAPWTVDRGSPVP